MATPFITNPSDPIIQMIRDFNILIDKNTFPAAKLLTYLNNHAFPKIRGYLLTARSQGKNEQGKLIFYEDISKLADPAVQASTNALILTVMTDSIVKDWVYTLAAQLTASWATNSIAAQIPEQQTLARSLYNDATADLKLLHSSPELTAAAAASALLVLDKTQGEKIPKIYMALDVNDVSYNLGDNSVKTYPGAQEVGTANLWVNQYCVTAQVAIGDTPTVIMNKCLAALRAYQSVAPTGAQINVVIGPNEGPLVAGTRQVTVRDVVGVVSQVTAQVQTNIGWMSFYTAHYDLINAALFCTLELLNAHGTLGIKGIVYGLMPQTTLDYNALSAKGPYSVFIDMSTGSAGTAAVLKGPMLAAVNKVDLSDAFYFAVDNVSKKTTQDGQVRYQIGNIAFKDLGPRAVNIPRGSTALDVARLIADDMGSVSNTQLVLPALRSPTSLVINGTPTDAPGLRIVPYRTSLTEDKVVVDILQVPPEVIFGVVPASLVTNGAFDNQSKSLVLDIAYHIPGGKAALALLADLGAKPSARAVQPVISSRLAQAFQDINYYNRGIF